MAQFIMAQIGRFALKHKASQARRRLGATIYEVAAKLNGPEERRDPRPALEEHPFAVASSVFLLGLLAGGELMLPSVVMLGSLLEILSRNDSGRE
ncbi:MAG TPA: hypothetical protein VMT61_19095 [Candidatus Binataceae bacterium]|nr:hypothetical protein [Candidatus Binataceae bacterium]